MNLSFYQHSVDEQRVGAVARHLFPSSDTHVERVMSGVSTCVYRITSQGRTYYLRILPEAEGSFVPEITVLTLLRQKHIPVPEVIHFEAYNEIVGRSIMVEAELKGLALSRSSLTRASFESLAMEAGRDLARINNLAVEGFGWLMPNQENPACLHARWPTYRAFALETREADLAYLSEHVLDAQASAALERVLTDYDSWLDLAQGYLAHGDFDTTHIFQDNGQYTGIIDFGEIRGASRWYDLAHFRIRDGALPPYRFFPALKRGYEEITPLSPAIEQQLRFTCVLLNLRALVRGLQTRPPDRYIWCQLETLYEDLRAL